MVGVHLFNGGRRYFILQYILFHIRRKVEKCCAFARIQYTRKCICTFPITLEFHALHPTDCCCHFFTIVHFFKSSRIYFLFSLSYNIRYIISLIRSSYLILTTNCDSSLKICNAINGCLGGRDVIKTVVV